MSVLGLAPVVKVDRAEPGPLELVFQRIEIEQVVVNVVEVILPAKDRTDHQAEVAGAGIDFAQRRKIRHGDAQPSARGEYPIPLRQHPRNLTALEVLEHVAVVDELDRTVLQVRQIVDARHVIDMGVVDDVDMHEARNVASPAAEMKFHRCHVLSCARLFRNHS